MALALAQWLKPVRCLEYPELELNNKVGQNGMPSVALGRKKWLRVGGPEAGPEMAAIPSVVETC